MDAWMDIWMDRQMDGCMHEWIHEWTVIEAHPFIYLSIYLSIHLSIYLSNLSSPYRVNCLARIFTEMAESFLFYIIHYPDTTIGDIKTLDLLVHAAKHHDYEVS